MKYISIDSTSKSQREAKKIANLLLEKKLAACVHLQPIESLYVWNLEIIKDDEYKLTIKTKASLYSKVEAVILEHNSYDTPEITASSLVAGFSDYLAWVSSELADE